MGAGLLGGTSALAQAYPTKPVTIIVPFAAGGTIAEAGGAWLGRPLRGLACLPRNGTPGDPVPTVQASNAERRHRQGCWPSLMPTREEEDRIVRMGAEVYSETPEQFAAFIQAESVKWGKVVKESGASLD